jgi:hypothetical protein
VSTAKKKTKKSKKPLFAPSLEARLFPGASEIPNPALLAKQI